MAVSYRGSLVTGYLRGGSAGGIIFSIENTLKSRHVVRVLRLIEAHDPEVEVTTIASGITPMIRTVWGTGITNGGAVVTSRVPFDTAVNDPSPGVITRVSSPIDGPSGAPITSPLSGNGWQQYTARNTTIVGQVLSWDYSLKPDIAGLLLHPGQALIVSWVTAVPVGGAGFVQIIWEEEIEDAGYAVAGVVRLGGTPVQGARVILLEDTNANMPEPSVTTITTDVDGAWSKTVASGVKVTAVAQHEESGTKYTALGKPFLEKP